MFVGRCIARLAIAIFPLLPIARGSGFKRLAARIHGASIGPASNFSPGLFLLRGHNVAIGRRNSFGVNCQFIDTSPIAIGDDCLVSHNVTFISGTHTAEFPYRPVAGPITIGDRVWIGAGVTIVGPCSIGDDAIIGAHSFVKGSVAVQMTIAGSPARSIRTR